MAWWVTPQYISEIIKEFIVQGKECYPDLFTYQADWLAHIDEFGLKPSYTVTYTGQRFYAPNTLEKPIKSAILKGSTKYRDIDTGEFLETFEEGRNLELVSVKMPVLTTTGKNLIGNLIYGNVSTQGTILDSMGQKRARTDYIPISSGTYYLSNNSNEINYFIIFTFDENKKLIRNRGWNNHFNMNHFFNNEEKYIIIEVAYDLTNTVNIDLSKIKVQLEQGSTPTAYEPYKTNILTVNEDVTLRSNGDICDELNLLTGQLTQRIDENGEVLSREIIKTVDLTILDQNGQNVKQLMSFNGGTHFNTGSLEGSPLPSATVTVETDLEETLRVCSLDGNTM